MRLYSYVVARDYGFAPNPFHGVCTLATCKPMIRATAGVDDLVVGVGPKTKGRNHLFTYAMRVTETLSFDEYWQDPRFRVKRPNLSGSRKQAYGDNIYHRNQESAWIQEDSHHSLRDGSPNIENLVIDTGADRVLISDDFSYWGAKGLAIPTRFRRAGIGSVRGHRSNFPPVVVVAVRRWFDGLPRGVHGRPLDWPAIA